jgi:hypothetical protein
VSIWFFEQEENVFEPLLWMTEHMIGPKPLQLTPGQTGDWSS